MSVVRDSHRMRTEVDILTRVGRSNRQARSFAAKIVGATPCSWQHGRHACSNRTAYEVSANRRTIQSGFCRTRKLAFALIRMNSSDMSSEPKSRVTSNSDDTGSPAKPSLRIRSHKYCSFASGREMSKKYPVKARLGHVHCDNYANPNRRGGDFLQGARGDMYRAWASHFRSDDGKRIR